MLAHVVPVGFVGGWSRHGSSALFVESPSTETALLTPASAAAKAFVDVALRLESRLFELVYRSRPVETMLRMAMKPDGEHECLAAFVAKDR